MKDFLLLTPGPTTVPARVLEKTALPLIHHRTKEYQAILARVNAALQKIFLTKHPVMTFASSGTGAMEASITNCLSRGDQVLSFSAGKWGERYRDIALAYGLDVKSFEQKYGEAVDPESVREALKKHPSAKAVLITLCETSTAVLHPVAEIAKITRDTRALLMVDAISGLMCDPLKMDEWGIDVVVCGSQKGLMLPPGLSFVALNDRAQSTLHSSHLPKYYFNFKETIEALKKNDTPFTPAVSLVRGLDEALVMILEEGVDRVWKRHAEVAQRIRQKIKDLGLGLFAKAPSAALTAIEMPKDILSGDLIRGMRDNHQVVMADGQGELKGKIVRFAHMGASATMTDAQRGVDAFYETFQKVKAAVLK